MLQNVQDVALNETSHPKSVHVYLLSHQSIPAIQSNKDIHNTIKPHFHSVSVSIVIFHTAQSYGQQYPRSLLKAIPNFSLGLIEAGIINTAQYTTTHMRARARCHGQIHINTHTHTHTHTHVRAHACAQTHVRAGTHKHTHVSARAHTHNEERKRQVIVLLAKE